MNSNVIQLPAGYGSYGSRSAQPLFIYRMDSDPMEPTLRDGDLAVWTPWKYPGPLPDGLYIVRLGDADTVKRVCLHVASGVHGLRVWSDNPRYAASLIPLGDVPADFIVGRVLGIVQRVA